VANANINGTKRNQPENGQGSRTQQSGEDVADTYARLSNGTYEEVQSRRQTFDTSSEGSTDVADTGSKRLERSVNEKLSASERSQDVANAESRIRNDNDPITEHGGSSTQEVFGDGDGVSGESAWWDFEPDVGRVAHGVPGRVYRLKGLGNSIVPKIAEEIGKAIIKAEREE
jgi:hypothetical protein